MPSPSPKITQIFFLLPIPLFAITCLNHTTAGPCPTGSGGAAPNCDCTAAGYTGSAAWSGTVWTHTCTCMWVGLDAFGWGSMPNSTLQWLLARVVPVPLHQTVTALPPAIPALPHGVEQHGHTLVLVCRQDPNGMWCQLATTSNNTVNSSQQGVSVTANKVQQV